MTFSKSFGYAIRGILYIAMQGGETRRIQLDEIAETLNIPRYFLGKILKRVAKEGFLDSNKGHNGGFSINEKTLYTTLEEIAELLGELNEIKDCALRFRHCSADNPCPLHHDVEPLRTQWKNFLSTTQIKDLTGVKSSSLLESIS